MNIKRIVEMEVEKKDLQVGDKIQIGWNRWKVLDIQDGKALIWKTNNIEDYVFNENGSNEYEGSDIQKYLMNEFPSTIPADILEDVTEEGFFLLTEAQVRKYMPQELDRIATDEHDRTTWWWTSTPLVGYGSYVRIIYPAGRVYGDDADGSHGVAPACWIHL